MRSFSKEYETLVKSLTSDDAQVLEKAGKKCRAILRNVPGDAAFLHLMGSIEFQLGHVDLAAGWIKKVLALKPSSAELHYIYAEMLSAQKRHTEAIAAFQQAISIKPGYVKALYGLALCCECRGDYGDAMKAYDDALAIEPNNPEVLNNLGVLLKNTGAIEAAESCFTRAISAKPDYPMPLNNLGLIKCSVGKVQEAKDLFRRALALKPEYPDALNNLGMVLYNLGMRAEAETLYKQALVLRPEYPDALNNLGIVFLHRGAFDKSISLFEEAIALHPQHSESLNNLGNALKAMGKLPEATAAYEKAIALKGNNPDYRNNLAMALLAAGRFEEGWHEYEWRWKSTQFVDVRMDCAKPLWQGEAAEGRVLLIRAEQGFGDTLQFCRYATLAARRGLRVILEVQPALVKLMGSVAGVEQVIAQGQPLPDFDLYCPMMSLPLAFHTTLQTIPAEVPYLSANVQSVRDWATRLTTSNDEAVKVGLVWAGRSRSQSPDLLAADNRRSMTPELFAPIMDTPHVRFYSLQKGGVAAPREFGLIDFMDECNDFTDTAALVSNLDLVISVDTAVAHLAAALGKPVWILNRFDSCWRWLQTREDSPWYSTLRLFRQQAPGDWESVMARVRAELQKVLP